MEDIKYGYINKFRKFIVPCIYEYTGDYQENMAPVVTNDQWAILKRLAPENKKLKYNQILMPI